MNKKVIAIDCDDVLFGTAPLILKHYNKTYGTHVNLTDVYSERPETWNVPDIGIFVKRISKYMLTDGFLKAPPLHDAVTAIHQLSGRYELHVVTGRPDPLAMATKDMLDQHFPGIFNSVVFTNFHQGTKSRPKAETCQEIGAVLMIEDNLHHALSVAHYGIKVLLFDSPWNQTTSLPENIRRVMGWQDVLALLLQRK